MDGTTVFGGSARAGSTRGEAGASRTLGADRPQALVSNARFSKRPEAQYRIDRVFLGAQHDLEHHGSRPARPRRDIDQAEDRGFGEHLGECLGHAGGQAVSRGVGGVRGHLQHELIVNLQDHRAGQGPLDLGHGDQHHVGGARLDREVDGLGVAEPAAFPFGLSGRPSTLRTTPVASAISAWCAGTHARRRNGL